MAETKASPTYKTHACVAAAAWTLLAVLAAVWTVWRESAKTREIAVAEGRVICAKDHALRAWAASYGGVYLPLDDKTPTSPRADRLPDRDLTTASGQRLRLMDPSCMVRQVYERYRDLYGVHGRLTSLKPLGTLDPPDAWERAALEDFESGTTEASEFTEIEGQPYLRLIQPLTTNEQCLQCHAHQGYRVGSVLGGFSVTVPITSLVARQNAAIAGNLTTLAVTWLTGLVGIVWMRRLLINNAHQVERAEFVLRAQRDLAAKLGAVTDLSEALTYCLDTALSSSQLDCGAIYLLNVDRGLDLAVHTGLSMEFLRNAAHYAPDSPRTLMVLQGHPIYCQYAELPFSLESGCLAEGLRTVAILPVQHNGRVIACISVGSRTLDTLPLPTRRTLEAIGSQIGAGVARIHAETTLRVLSRAVEQSSSAMVITDRNGLIEYVNPRFTATTGYAAEEVIGRSPSFLESGEQSDAFYAELWQTITSGRDWRGEFHNRRRDGTLYWEAATISPVTDGRGQITHYAAIKDDITEQKQRDEELKCYAAALEQSSRLAESATRAKSEFLANMSHEIRTPITAILGYADVLADSPLELNQQEALEIIRRNGDHLLAIVNDVLDLSKIEAGKLRAEPTRCSPFAILDNTISLMQIHAQTKGLFLTAECVPPIPETIWTDPTRLQQILYNLVSNAIKFTDNGGVRLELRLLERDTDAASIQFQVTDSGIGISPDQCSRLFRPFEQADTSTTRKFGGTGLGLAISKRLAEALGGDITVQSTVGRGSVFRLVIPAGPLSGVQMLSHTAAEGSRMRRRATRCGREQIQLSCRILLAEDGPDNQRLIAFLLEKAGAAVVLADNGQAACEKALAAAARGEPFDLVLMDMQMPVMDGYAAVRQLRTAGYTDPIIAITAHAMSEDRQKCLDAGCNDYLTKPIDRQTLLATIATWLTPNEMHSARI
jgi:PAS domain S-box-containing protein